MYYELFWYLIHVGYGDIALPGLPNGQHVRINRRKYTHRVHPSATGAHLY